MFAKQTCRYGGFYELTHGPVLGPHVGPVSLVCKQQLLRPGSGHVSNAYVSTGTELVWGVAASVPISIALKFIPLDDGQGARM